jgi:putative tryptophan/tyrosine transport system substrate-binding protein
VRRREFIKGLSGAAVLGPFAARAEEQVRRVGVLMTTSLDDPETQARTKAFLQGMRELGWIEGRNIQFDIRWDTGAVDSARKVAGRMTASRS